jgi:hypothetical protein
MVAVAGAGLVLALILIARGLSDGVTFAAFLSYAVALALIGAAAVTGYWALALVNLRYEVADGALTIVWGLSRQVIPVAEMQRIVRGRSLGMPRVQGLALPGWPCYVGRSRVPRMGTVLFYSTHRAPNDILYIVTAETRYGISPAAPGELIRALQLEIDRGYPPGAVRQALRRHPLAALPAWNDRLLLVSAGVATVLALVAAGIIFARYSGTPARAVVGFPESSTEANRERLLQIPAAAITLLVINIIAALALHRALRPVAYVLLLGGIVAEALLVAAAVIAG